MRAFLNGKMMFKIFIILSISQLCLLAEPPVNLLLFRHKRILKISQEMENQRVLPLISCLRKLTNYQSGKLTLLKKEKAQSTTPNGEKSKSSINLDIGTNRFMRQKIQIKAGVYLFSFKCAAKVGKVQSSALSIHWNSKKVKQFFLNDEQVHIIEIALEAVEGQNIIEIRSEGEADKHGMSISDLRLTNANLLKNGDFALPPIQREWESIKKLPFWEIDFAQKGKGSFYNKRWGPVQEVLELDAEENYAIKQKIQLKKGTYVFQMSYAAKIGCVATSGFSVSWNGKKLKQILASDENIHQFERVVEAVDEENILEIKGESASDRFGMTIANLKLFTKQTIDNLEITNKFIHRNFLANGNFRKTAIQKEIQLVREIPGWESTTMLQLGKGKKYNPRWEAESLVLNLDAQANNFIRQKINLSAGSYLLRIKYASKSGSAGSSAMSIYWNAKLYKQVNAIDQDIHLLELRLVAIAGDNIIQISGLSDKQGMCIADVSLNIDYAPVKYLLGVDNCIASYSKDRKIPYADEENIIRNGDFNELETPLNGAPYKYYYTLPYWISGTVEKGQGPTYNSRWSGSIQVLEMDSEGNTFIKQNFKLAKGNYIFYLRYAAKNGMAYSSEMSIYWNGQLVIYIKPEDEQIHDLELVLEANAGDNSIQIRGEGYSDNYGMSITGLRLVLEKKKSYFLYKNFLINGNFKQTVINGDSQYVQSIPGWESKTQIQLANGYKYNSLWKNSIVLQLNSNENSLIRQKVILPVGFYLFRLNYAARVGFADRSAMSIYWNSKLVKKISANDEKLHTLQIRLKSLQGYNILQIKGEGKSDSKGISIADLSLVVENSSPLKYLLSTDESQEFSPTLIGEQNLLKNADFAQSPITGVYQLIKQIPNWQISVSQAEKGRGGSEYNANWGNLYVIELDGLQNYAITQRVRLLKGKYTFKMLYAAKQNRVDSMGMSIHWNGNKIIEMMEKDSKIHEYEVVLEAIDGENVLSIKGEGKPDRQGITIANLRLTKGQSKTSAKTMGAEQVNLIKNGDFTELLSPLGSQIYKYYDSLPNWTSGKVEIGKGFAYNFRWGQKEVCEMDSAGNTFIKQNIKLTEGNYVFSLKYTTKRGMLSSSQMSIIWNGQKIKHITSKDEQIQSLEIGLIAVDGQNAIEIRGEGPSDNYGMTIADLKLIKQSAIIKIRQIQQNLLKNSNFQKLTINGEFQSLTSLPGWEISDVQKGKGSYYNPKWTQIFIIKLNAKKSSYLRQRIYLSKGIFAFGIDYAASSNSDSNSGLALFWNGKKVLNISCVNNEIHHLQLNLNSVNGQNVLQIRGEGTIDSQGVTIANLRLLKREDPADNPISQEMLKLNLLRNSFFSLPVQSKSCSYFNYLPYWDTKAIRKCRGSIYRQKWAAFEFLQMGGNLKSTIKQVIILQKGQYEFGMLFAAQGKNTQASQLSIYWNGKKVACLFGNDQEMHEFQMSLTSSEGDNYLQLRGEGKVDDDSILITQLSLKQHSNAQANSSIFDSDL